MQSFINDEYLSPAATSSLLMQQCFTVCYRPAIEGARSVCVCVYVCVSVCVYVRVCCLKHWQNPNLPARSFTWPDQELGGRLGGRRREKKPISVCVLKDSALNVI